MSMNLWSVIASDSVMCNTHFFGLVKLTSSFFTLMHNWFLSFCLFSSLNLVILLGTFRLPSGLNSIITEKTSGLV